jgi:hypothetical protein
MSILNPWLALPSRPPYLLPCDSDAICAHNATAPEAYRLQLDLLPEPFFGSIKAPAVLLLLNPGFDDRDSEAHARPGFQSALRNNYTHGSSEFPFYYLDPVLDGPGRKWWERKLGPVMKIDRKKLAISLLCVQYFPYHSRRFRSSLRLDSQKYGFHLVRSAINRGAVVVIMRAKKLWIKEIPELEGYSLSFTLKNPRNVTISRRNCEDFDKVFSAIGAGNVKS